MIGIGIIGAGRICAAHAIAANALEETRLVGIADTDPERVAGAVARFGGRAYAGYGELLADPEVDAIVVGLPHFLHREVAVAALEAGKHALIEKPMAMTVEECDAMIAAEKASGRKIMVAHSQHYFPANIVVRQRIAEGEIGTVVAATDTWYKPFWEGGQRPPWFLDATKGGGMWPMNGSHMIDRLLFLLQDRVTSVKARVGNPIFGLPTTDMGFAFLQFAGGAAATIAHAGFRDGVNRFEAEITGTEGQIRLSGDRGGGPTFLRSRDGQWEERPVPELEVPVRPGVTLTSPIFPAQMREFALAIQQNRPPATDSGYGREVVRILEACEESSRTGRDLAL
jgi:phthalate 4,5-cis-dihydrodiol dehydrogenase